MNPARQALHRLRDSMHAQQVTQPYWSLWDRLYRRLQENLVRLMERA